jgi:predicted dehydrogenase
MIRIGIVGIGHLGRIHLKVLQDLPVHFHIAGVYDHNKDRMRELQSENPQYAIFSSYQELLLNVDAVAIVASTPAHFDLAAQAISAGKAVFIEKPICALLSDAQQLKVLAVQHQVLVQVGHIERFNPLLMAVFTQIKGKAIQVLKSNRSASFQLRGSEVSVVLDLMIHDIDLVLALTQAAIEAVEVTAKQQQSEHPDEVWAKLTFSNGMVAELFASRIAAQRTRTIDLSLLQETYHLDLINQAMTIQSSTGEHNSIQVKPHNAMQQQWREFAHCYEQQLVPRVDIQAGIAALQLALQIEASAKEYISQNTIQSIQ